ncbi:primosomal protein N' [Catenovulum sp. 2E275]|uniref:primosomal protein N' n=1 Tax=Catenovulum sp. 2E275 TaxID=2980497 RepID=UPI0021D1D6AD|nr:primosomal protein N' [Catenovulum sp. 2E275]MCU4677606.1 primosomal protein N' [Catenovulum sp. 2E275]
MAVAQVALAVPLRRLFDYLIPANLNCRVGMRVSVPFGRQKLVGFVVNITETSEYPEHKLKQVLTCFDDIPLMNSAQMAMLNWLCQYYLCPPGEVFINLLPKKLKQGDAAQLVSEPIWQLNQPQSADFSNRAKQQAALYQYLQTHGATAQSLLKQAGFSKAIINQLDKKQLITTIDVLALPPKALKINLSPYQLHPQQNNAIKQIESTEGFKTYLLEGVTGSGKTEVYMQLMAKVLAKGQQVLILVPEIGLTPQTLKRFQARFECEIAILHSELNDSERHNAWLKASKGLAPIVLGTRSAVLVPTPNLGLIILDEEHDSSYKQQDGLRYNARDVAIKRAASENCKIILGSATPSLESLNNAQQGRFVHLTMLERAQKNPPPKPQLLDIKDQPLQAGLAYGVVQAIEHHINQGNQVLIFLNRRGFSPALICHECGWVCQCNRCEQHFTFHKALAQVVCHHCGDMAKPPMQCAECGSTQIIDWGIGTEQLADWLCEKFPQAKPIRIDRDSVRRKGELENKLSAITQGEHQIMIGTQMLAKGHHFPNLTLTVVVNIDSALYSSDFRAVEKMAQLLVQVGGRAGREEKPGQVILQTHFPEHEYLQTLIHKGYPALQQKLLAEREAMHLPPFYFWAILRLESVKQDKIIEITEIIEQLFSQQIQPHYQNVELLASMPAPQEKRAGKYRYLMIFQTNKRSMLNAAMQQLIMSLEQNSFSQQVRWTLDIDPQELN